MSKQLKVYAHWEGDPEPFTKVLRADPSCHCISDLLDNFLEAFRSKYPASAAAAATISRTDLRVSVGEAGRPLPHGTPASVLHPGCDLFIRCSAKPTPSSPEAPTAPPSQAAQQNTQPPAPGTTPTSVLDALRQPLPDPIHKQLSDSSTQQPASASSATTDQHNVKQAAQKGPQGASAKQPAGPVAGDVLDGPQMGLVVRALWARAGQAQQLQSYRAASDMLRQTLDLIPEAPSSSTSSGSTPAGSPTALRLATHRRLARLWLAAGNAREAAAWALEAARLRPEDPGVLELAGDCLREGGRPREAAAHYQSVLELWEEAEAAEAAAGRTGTGGAAAAKATAAAAAAAEEAGDGDQGAGPGRPPTPADQRRVRLSLAACLYDIPGQEAGGAGGGGVAAAALPYSSPELRDLAASLVMAVLEEDAADWDALYLYGRIALDRGLREDALRVALRLVVGRPQHAGAKALLASCIQDEAGCQLLLRELHVPRRVRQHVAQMEAAASSSSSSTITTTVTTANGSERQQEQQHESAASGVAVDGDGRGPDGGNGDEAESEDADGAAPPGTAAALGFVATVVKERGCVGAAVALLRAAVALAPCCGSYALNLVHALELRQALGEAVAVAAAYCQQRGGQLAGLWLTDVAALLRSVPPLGCLTELRWLPPWPGQGEGARTGQQEQEAAGGLAPGVAAATPQSSEPAGPEHQQGRQQAVPQVDKVTYSSDELDELALLFTAAKVLYVGGALREAAALCDMVEPLAKRSAVELHTTLIRNEAAYFGCVMQLLRDHPPPHMGQRGPAAAGGGGSSGGRGGEVGQQEQEQGQEQGEGKQLGPRPLYMCGDSHCLSGGWRVVGLRGEPRLLVPLLVTGVKVWHLRPASVFYPKRQLEATLQLLPDGAQVVLVLGEIDCREGLLLAVQKGKYDNLDSAIAATVDIYVSRVRQLVYDRSFEVFVHAVPPVLKETRHLVTPFEAALRRALKAARAADPILAQKVHHLDFFDDLLVPSSSSKNNSNSIRSTSSGGKEASGTEGSSGSGGGDGGGGGGGAGAVAQGVEAGGDGATVAARVLRPDLAFDGTHLSPAYIPLLDRALRAVG